MKRLIRSPRLWPVETSGHSPRVTWMELFFDLIFAAAVAQVGTPLLSNYTVSGVLRYSFLFIPVWLAWNGHTLFSTRFDTDDLIQRLLVLVQSFIVAVMAANAKESLDSPGSAGFGAAYAGMRVILMSQSLRASRLPQTRSLTLRYAAGYGIAAVLWTVSALTPLPTRYALWALALAVDLATPWCARKHSLRYPPDPAHYPERFGLFTIILLGEFVAAVMRGIESQEYWSVPAATTAFGSMAFGFIVWCWYSGGARACEARYVKTRRQALLFHVWDYAHLPLFLGIGVAGVGFHRAISVPPGASLEHSEGIILCGAVALLMLALTAIGSTPDDSAARIVPQGIVLGLVCALGFVAAHLPAVILVILLGLCAIAQTVFSRGRGGLTPAHRVIRERPGAIRDREGIETHRIADRASSRNR